MKVLLVNGSPHEKGCVYTALTEIADTLKSEVLTVKFSGSAIVLCRDVSAAGSVGKRERAPFRMNCILDSLRK